jgi:hypothetical protein
MLTISHEFPNKNLPRFREHMIIWNKQFIEFQEKLQNNTNSIYMCKREAWPRMYRHFPFPMGCMHTVFCGYNTLLKIRNNNVARIVPSPIIIIDIDNYLFAMLHTSSSLNSIQQPYLAYWSLINVIIPSPFGPQLGLFYAAFNFNGMSFWHKIYVLAPA